MDIQQAVEALQASNLRHNWHNLRQDTKQRLFNQFGYYADTEEAFVSGLEDLITEHGANLIFYALTHPTLTVTEILEEI